MVASKGNFCGDFSSSLSIERKEAENWTKRVI